MILLDTNVLSELMRQEPNETVFRWADAQSPRELFISAVTRAEIEFGIALLPAGRRRDRVHTVAVQMFADFSGRCLPFDERAAWHFGAVRAARIRTGRPIGIQDGQIAAIALANRLTLATRNTRDFDGINGLSLVDPFAE